MPALSTISAFALASFVLAIIPGPSVMYITTRGASQGPRAGLVSAAGIQSGSFVHVAAAAAGLSALIAASATAFTAVKVLGGLYLIYLGVRALRTRPSADGDAADETTAATVAGRRIAVRSYRRLYVDGFVVNALNPKTAVFFLAFLPQFVDPARGATTLQVVVLGLTFVVVAFASDSIWGVGSGLIGDAWRARRASRPSRKGPIASGLLYIGLGTTTILAGRHTA